MASGNTLRLNVVKLSDENLPRASPRSTVCFLPVKEFKIMITLLLS